MTPLSIYSEISDEALFVHKQIGKKADSNNIIQELTKVAKYIAFTWKEANVIFPHCFM